MLQQQLSLLICCLAFVYLLQNQKVDGVRLCGRRLADLLNFVCKNYGGFHSPGENNAELNASQDDASSLLYNSESRVMEQTVDMESGIIVISKRNSGIVDECCKKQCSRTTLLSYCAGAPFPVNDELFLEEENASFSNQENINDLHLDEQNAMTLNQQSETALNIQPPQGEPANTRPMQPNLGLSTRNRPIFIVLTRAEEASSEEYKI